jgi:hypothetical protein
VLPAVGAGVVLRELHAALHAASFRGIIRRLTVTRVVRRLVLHVPAHAELLAAGIGLELTLPAAGREPKFAVMIALLSSANAGNGGSGCEPKPSVAPRAEREAHAWR